jgi:hypothetical protein
VLVEIIRNMSSKLYPDFIPIYRYMAYGFWCQGVKAKKLKPPLVLTTLIKIRLAGTVNPPGGLKALNVRSSFFI